MIGDYTGVVDFQFAGDLDAARSKIPLARKFIGELVHDAGFNNLQVATRERTMEDKTLIRVTKNFAIISAFIFVPVTGGKFIEEICTGFTVNISSTIDYGSVYDYKPYLYGIEPNLDKNDTKNWIRVPSFYNWENDEQVGQNEYGFYAKPDMVRLYGETDRINGYDLSLRAFWENITTYPASHGARLGHFEPGAIVPDFQEINDKTPGIILDTTPQQMIDEQDAIFFNLPRTNESGLYWHAGRYYNGSIDMVATENYFFAAEGNIIKKDKYSFKIESPDAVLAGETYPYYSGISNPIMEGIQKQSISLLPKNSTLTYGNLTGQHIVDTITPIDSFYNPIKYLSDGVTPDPSQYHLNPGYYYVFMTGGTVSNSKVLNIVEATVPTKTIAGRYTIKIKVQKPAPEPRTDRSGDRIKVEVELFGLQALKSKYKFDVITGNKSDEFTILIDTRVKISKTDVDGINSGSLTNPFLSYHPEK